MMVLSNPGMTVYSCCVASTRRARGNTGPPDYTLVSNEGFDLPLVVKQADPTRDLARDASVLKKPLLKTGVVDYEEDPANTMLRSHHLI